MHQKLLRSAHYIELGSYHYWPVLVPRGIRLYTYEQIPVFLKDNPYITDGYRAYLPSRLCLKSLFILSNETVNIWSHLLGFVLFFTLGIYDLTAVLPAAGASREDFVICSVCLFCFQVCMLCSVGYHLFCCHRSEKTSRRWMALDYAGISIGILGCYVSGVFYAFYCNNYWRQLYLITVLAMILAVFFAQIHPSYLTQQWQRLRSIIFCSVSGYGIIPTIHWIWLNGGMGASIVQEFAPRVVVMYFIAAVAFLFYISKVPERYFPGQLNYLGSSHQVWHILAVVLLYWWHQSTVYIMQYRHSKPCPEYSADLDSILSGVLKKTTALHKIQDAFPSQSFAVLQSSTKQVFLEWDNEKRGLGGCPSILSHILCSADNSQMIEALYDFKDVPRR